jgi:hypothetical protein
VTIMGVLGDENRGHRADRKIMRQGKFPRMTRAEPEGRRKRKKPDQRSGLQGRKGESDPPGL